MKNFRKILSTKHIQPEWITLMETEQILLEVIPFIETNRKLDAALITKIKLLSNEKITAIFTSQNAVESVFSQINNPSGWQIFCIVGKTKSTLLNYLNPNQIVATAANGVELAEKIINHHPSGLAVFFCGNKRMPSIPDALKQAGIVCHEMIVYQTLTTAIKLNEQFDGILFFSPSAVESFFSVNKTSEKTILFSIGTTTEQAIRRFSDNEVITAQFPSEGEMVRNVIKHKFSN